MQAGTFPDFCTVDCSTALEQWSKAPDPTGCAAWSGRCAEAAASWWRSTWHRTRLMWSGLLVLVPNLGPSAVVFCSCHSLLTGQTNSVQERVAAVQMWQRPGRAVQPPAEAGVGHPVVCICRYPEQHKNWRVIQRQTWDGGKMRSISSGCHRNLRPI